MKRRRSDGDKEVAPTGTDELLARLDRLTAGNIPGAPPVVSPLNKAARFGVSEQQHAVAVEDLTQDPIIAGEHGYVVDMDTGTPEQNQAMPYSGVYFETQYERTLKWRNDENVQFVTLVAGLTNRPLEAYLDVGSMETASRAERDYAAKQAAQAKLLTVSAAEKQKELEAYKRQYAAHAQEYSLTRKLIRDPVNLWLGGRGDMNMWRAITGPTASTLQHGMLFPFYMLWQYTYLRDALKTKPAATDQTSKQDQHFITTVLAIDQKMYVPRDTGDANIGELLEQMDILLEQFSNGIKNRQDFLLCVTAYVVLRDIILRPSICPCSMVNDQEVLRNQSFNGFWLQNVVRHYIAYGARHLPEFEEGMLSALPDPVNDTNFNPFEALFVVPEIKEEEGFSFFGDLETKSFYPYVTALDGHLGQKFSKGYIDMNEDSPKLLERITAEPLASIHADDDSPFNKLVNGVKNVLAQIKPNGDIRTVRYDDLASEMLATLLADREVLGKKGKKAHDLLIFGSLYPVLAQYRTACELIQCAIGPVLFDFFDMVAPGPQQMRQRNRTGMFTLSRRLNPGDWIRDVAVVDDKIRERFYRLHGDESRLTADMMASGDMYDFIVYNRDVFKPRTSTFDWDQTTEQSVDKMDPRLWLDTVHRDNPMRLYCGAYWKAAIKFASENNVLDDDNLSTNDARRYVTTAADKYPFSTTANVLVRRVLPFLVAGEFQQKVEEELEADHLFILPENSLGAVSKTSSLLPQEPLELRTFDPGLVPTSVSSASSVQDDQTRYDEQARIGIASRLMTSSVTMKTLYDPEINKSTDPASIFSCYPADLIGQVHSVKASSRGLDDGSLQHLAMFLQMDLSPMAAIPLYLAYLSTATSDESSFVRAMHDYQESIKRIEGVLHDIQLRASVKNNMLPRDQLAQATQDMYVPTGAYQARPTVSGYAVFTPFFESALQTLMNAVRTVLYYPDARLEDLTSSANPGLRYAAAEYIAAHEQQLNVRFPSQYKKDKEYGQAAYAKNLATVNLRNALADFYSSGRTHRQLNRGQTGDDAIDALVKHYNIV